MSNKKYVPYFDLILVYTSHRRHVNYLNIIKYLSSYLSIGILRLPIPKFREIEETYFQTCIQFGATLIEGPAQCHTLMVSRISEDALVQTTARISNYKKLLINVDMPANGATGLKKIAQITKSPVLLTPSIKHFGDLEPESKQILEQTPMEMVEVGLPFSKYPCFKTFETDYLLAYPSGVVIKDAWELYGLLKNMVLVLKSLPKEAKITVKPHINMRGERLTRTLFKGKFTKFSMPLCVFQIILSFIHLMDLKFRGHSFFKLLPKRILYYFALLHNDYIFTRCTNLLDEYPGFAIEHFMPGVRLGFISGLSSSIISAIWEKKKIYYCDKRSFGHLHTYKYISEHLRVNEWEGFTGDFDDWFDNSVRKADLIEYLKSTIPSSQI